MKPSPFPTPSQLLAAVEHLPLYGGVTVIVTAWEDGTLSVEKRHGFVAAHHGATRTLRVQSWRGIGNTVEEAVHNATYCEEDIPDVATPGYVPPQSDDWLWEIVADRETP